MESIIAALPIIISLIILEGLLSVDNALVLAAMVKHLPEKQQNLALKAGLIGAYVLRGVSLLFVGFLIANPWVRLVGGAYLIYLMCKHLGIGEEGEENAHTASGGFWSTVIAVEFACSCGNRAQNARNPMPPSNTSPSSNSANAGPISPQLPAASS